ncbi:MAG: hydroxyethylthiazole kinase [Brevinema sp.]
MIREIKDKIESQKPLILNISNQVTMNFMANALLAVGASPVMSVCVEDAQDLLAHADAVNINIGTLDTQSILLATTLSQTNLKKKPLILDPVGAGASILRTNTALSILPYTSVLRGNIGEISALMGNHDTVNGVDSRIDFHPQNSDLFKQITSFSKTHNCILGISGKTDLIINGENHVRVEFGSPMMSKITGMGCVLSAITAAFCAVERDYFKATRLAFAYYTLCGELAEQKTKSLGFFSNYFLEILANPDYDYLEEKFQI